MGPEVNSCNLRSLVFSVVTAIAALLLGSCGGDASNFALGGSVTGLLANTQLVLQNGGDRLSVSGNGSFQFPTSLAPGNTFAVTVATQPAGSTCLVANGNGAAGANSGSQVSVTCAPNSYSVVVQVSGLVTPDKALPGLTGSGLVLQNNGTDDLAIQTDGSQVFPASVASGSAYRVTVAQQPVGRACAAAQADGTITSTGVVVSVACTPIADASPFHLYVANGATVTTYAVDAATGLPGSVLGATFGSSLATAFGTSGQFAYSIVGEGIATSAVNLANGALELVSKVLTVGSTNLAIDPKGHYLYSAVHDSNIGDYAVFYALDEHKGTPVPTAASPYPFRGKYAPEPSGRIVFAVGGTDSLTAFSRNGATGTWDRIDAISDITIAEYIEPLETQANLVFHPNGRFAYYTTRGGSVAAYSMNLTSGALTRIPGSPFAAASAYGPVLIDPTGRFAYTASRNIQGVINAYGIDQNSGALAPLRGSPFVFGSTRTVSLALHPNGRNLYATTSSAGDLTADGVLQCAVDPATGVPTVLAGVPVPLPTGIKTSTLNNGIKFAPTGQFAYMLSSGDFFLPGSLAAMKIDPLTGALNVRVAPLGLHGGGDWFEVR